jgi:hypothetical protein
MNPSSTAQQVLVRNLLYKELENCQHDGIMLGSVVLVPPQVVVAEMERRESIIPNLPWRWW